MRPRARRGTRARDGPRAQAAPRRAGSRPRSPHLEKRCPLEIAMRKKSRRSSGRPGSVLTASSLYGPVRVLRLAPFLLSAQPLQLLVQVAALEAESRGGTGHVATLGF